MAAGPPSSDNKDCGSPAVGKGPKPPENKPPTTKGVTEIEVSKPIDAPKEQKQTEQHLDKVEKELSGFERSTLRWTKATFVVVFATGLFICLQWWVMRGQLDEMKSGGIDTGHLVESAKKQAAANVQQVSNFAALAMQAKNQSDAAKEIAEATKKQVSLMKQQIVGTQMAIVDFGVGADGDAKVSFGAQNMGPVNARNIHADLLTTIRAWPSRNILLGPFKHPIHIPTIGADWKIKGTERSGKY